MKTTLILGGPGSGKTETLLQYVGETLSWNKSPDRIAFVSFTNTAADEARDRAAAAFNLDTKTMPYFSTIHSLAFRQMEMKKHQVFQGQAVREFGDWIGEPISNSSPLEDDDTGDSSSITRGDRMLFLVGHSRATGLTLRETWETVEVGGEQIGWWELERFERGLREYKQDKGLYDFADMLDLYLEKGMPVYVDVAIIDEAQDLSAKQWAVIRKAFSDVQEMIVAGDDDQAVHVWGGADLHEFLRLEAERRVLPKSHRLPSKVFDLAAGIAHRIGERYEKDWAPRDAEGEIHRIAHFEDADFSRPGSWYILVRNHFYTRNVEAYLKGEGAVFTTKYGPSIKDADRTAVAAWAMLTDGESVPRAVAMTVLRALGTRRVLVEERPYRINDLAASPEVAMLPWNKAFRGIHPLQRRYYENVVERHGTLDVQASVYLGTIHSVKGGQADNVLVLPDMTRTTWVNKDDDAEHRVAYVAVTRARETLWICEPQGKWWYEY